MYIYIEREREMSFSLSLSLSAPRYFTVVSLFLSFSLCVWTFFVDTAEKGDVHGDPAGGLEHFGAAQVWGAEEDVGRRRERCEERVARLRSSRSALGHRSVGVRGY